MTSYFRFPINVVMTIAVRVHQRWDKTHRVTESIVLLTSILWSSLATEYFSIKLQFSINIIFNENIFLSSIWQIASSSIQEEVRIKGKIYNEKSSGYLNIFISKELHEPQDVFIIEALWFFSNPSNPFHFHLQSEPNPISLFDIMNVFLLSIFILIFRSLSQEKLWKQARIIFKIIYATLKSGM